MRQGKRACSWQKTPGRQTADGGQQKARGGQRLRIASQTIQFKKDARCARSTRPESGGDLKNSASRAGFSANTPASTKSSVGAASKYSSCGAKPATSTPTASVAPRHMQPDSFSHPPGGRLTGRAGEPSAFATRDAIATTTSAAPTWQCQFNTSTSSENAAGSRGRRWETY